VTGPPAPLRIVIADDQATVREGLTVLLGLLPGIEVAGAAADGEQALELVARTHPDVVLLDLHMPVLDGVEVTRRLTAHHSDVAIVVLTAYDDDTSVLAALHAGARGYLTKDARRADIARALHSAASGLSVLDPAAQAALLTAAARPGPAPQRKLPDGLTRREAEILTLIASGMTNPGIAARLCLSVPTVKSHINRIFAKTGSADRAAAIRYARGRDLG
jgi:DNA-binding NarL/FixJ family response regulator